MQNGYVHTVSCHLGPPTSCGMWINNQCKSHSVHPKLCHNMLLPPKLQTAHLHVHIKASKNIRFDLTPPLVSVIWCVLRGAPTYEIQTSWFFHLLSQFALKIYFFPIAFNCFETIDREWQKLRIFLYRQPKKRYYFKIE